MAGRHSNTAGNCRDLTRHTQNVKGVSLILGMWLFAVARRQILFQMKLEAAKKKKKTQLAKLFKNGGFVQDTPVCR